MTRALGSFHVLRQQEHSITRRHIICWSLMNVCCCKGSLVLCMYVSVGLTPGDAWRWSAYIDGPAPRVHRTGVTRRCRLLLEVCAVTLQSITRARLSSPNHHWLMRAPPPPLAACPSVCHDTSRAPCVAFRVMWREKERLVIQGAWEQGCPRTSFNTAFNTFVNALNK